MSRRRKVINAEIVDGVPSQALAPIYPASMTEQEIKLNSERLKCRLKARLEAIEELSPEERYDAMLTMTSEIKLRYADRILERESWLSNPDPDIRAEALNFMVEIQNLLNSIQSTEIALHNALGLNEQRGVAPGGKEVPKLLLPSMTREELEKSFGELPKAVN